MGVLKDFDCSKVQKEEAVEGKEDYCVIEPGLSYCGHCTNQQCRAFRKLVVLNRGEGHHLVNDDIVCGVLRCPVCRAPFELKYCALYRCKAVVTVHLQQEERTEMKAEGNEIVKLGARSGQPMFENGLLSIKAKVSKECVIS